MGGNGRHVERQASHMIPSLADHKAVVTGHLDRDGSRISFKDSALRHKISRRVPPEGTGNRNISHCMTLYARAKQIIHVFDPWEEGHDLTNEILNAGAPQVVRGRYLSISRRRGCERQDQAGQRMLFPGLCQALNA